MSSSTTLKVAGIAFIMLLIANMSFSQQKLKDIKVNINAKDASLKQVLLEIEKQTGLSFFYLEKQVQEDDSINLIYANTSLEKVLFDLAEKSGIQFHRNNNQIVIKGTPKIKKQHIVVRQGVVSGKVTDVDTGEPLPGATVFFKGTTIGASSDLDGKYFIANAPDGKQILEVHYIGYQNYEAEIQVEAGFSITHHVSMTNDVQTLGEVVVKGSLEGQQKALNQQRTADNIKNVISSDLIGRFPDLNIAEALQRVPGITINRRKGEGSTVQIRGTPANFTTISINGEQIPSVEQDGVRNESLDLIPADMIGSMEVSKAVTSDMDGDAVGGAINLRSPIAKKLETTGKVEIGAGYNSMSQGVNGVSRVSLSKRFLPNYYYEEGKLGLKFGLSYFGSDNTEDLSRANYRIVDSTDLRSNQFSPSLLNERVLEDFRYEDFLSNRRRIGASTTIDYKFGKNSDIRANFLYSHRDDEDNRRRARYDMLLSGTSFYVNENLSESARIRRDIALANISKRNYTANIDAKIGLGQNVLDVGVFYTDSKREGTQNYLAFRRRLIDIFYDNSDPDFPAFSSPDANSSIFDPLLMNAVDRFEDNTIINIARNYAAKANLEIPISIGKHKGLLKSGMKIRNIYSERKKDADISNYSRTLDDLYKYPQEEIYANLVDNFEDRDYMLGNARFGRGLSKDKVLDFLSETQALGIWQPIGDQSEIASLSDFFEASEQVYAAYTMAKLNIGKTMFLAGLRFERTVVDYSAFELEVNDRDLDRITDRSGGTSFNFLLPNIHFKYSPDRMTNIRIAVTSTYARPNFRELVPVADIDIDNRRVDKGNPELIPSRSLNLDIMLEKYLPNVGILSVGAFSKRIDDFLFTSRVQIDETNFQRYFEFYPIIGLNNEPVPLLLKITENGSLASVYGLEANIQAQLDFLPGFLSGLGMYANYTYVYSESEVPGRDGKFPLTNQADHFGNFALSYDYKGFSIRGSINYLSDVVSELGDANNNDEIIDNEIANTDLVRVGRYQLDVNANYRFKKHFSIFAEFLNVTNQPTIEYEGTRNFPTRIEYIGWWNRFGASYRF